MRQIGEFSRQEEERHHFGNGLAGSGQIWPEGVPAPIEATFVHQRSSLHSYRAFNVSSSTRNNDIVFFLPCFYIFPSIDLRSRIESK